MNRTLPLVSRGAPTTRGLLAAAAPVAGIAVVLVAAAVTTPDFYTQESVSLVALQVGLIGITAIGQTLVLLVGGIDLSVGAVIGITTVIVARQTDGLNGQLPAALALALLAGVAVGLANAWLVLGRLVPPFVATFATFVLLQGVITAWTGGAPSGRIPAALGPLGSGRLLGLPVPVWLFAVLAAVAAVVLVRTTLGRALYATGANRRASQLAGIRTSWVITGCYVLAAVLAVIAGLVNAGFVGYVDAELSRTLNLDSIAASVIGGVALRGGRGTIGQTVLGVVLLALLLVWMVQLEAGAGAQLVVVGAAILLAVWLRAGRSPNGTAS